MKVAINIQADIQEIEVIINCMAEDENVQRIVSALDSLNTKLCCRRQGELFQIALNDILYIESVDRKTFIYTEQQIYETDKRLYELENHLKNRSFFRASKAVIINLKRTKSIRPEIGARLLLTMDNGEKVITPQTLLCMVSAIILSALYSMICVDGQESLYAIKSRLIICGIPCVLICSVLSVNYGLPSLILDLLGITDRGTGISIWLIAVILSSAVLILALYLLERHYRRVGEKYDSALSQYKTREEAIPAE